jgi:hypothetical protein
MKHLKYSTFCLYWYDFEQGNPAGIKQVFDSLGIADSFVRLPLVQVDAL